MSTSEFYLTRQRNEDGYRKLFDIEVLLRELVAAKLMETHGNQWMKRGLPPDVRETVKNGIAYERSISWMKLTPHNPLYFINFTDLKKIVLNGQNWKDMFEPIFVSRSPIENALTELEPLRNKIAHSLFISEVEAEFIIAAYNKITNPIQSSLLNQLFDNACSYTPIYNKLESLLSELEAVLRMISQGTSYTNRHISNLNVAKEWWFNEDYLGSKLEHIHTLFEFLEEYGKIPDGIGQNIVRRRLVSNANAVNVAKEAIGEVKKVLKDAEKFEYRRTA